MSRVARRALAYIATLVLLDWLAPEVLYRILQWVFLLFVLAVLAWLVESIVWLVNRRTPKFWMWCRRATRWVAGVSPEGAISTDPEPKGDSVGDKQSKGTSLEVKALGVVLGLLVFGLPWAMFGAGPVGNHNAIRLLLGPYTVLVFLLVAHLGLLVDIVFRFRWPSLQMGRLLAGFAAAVVFEVLEVVALFSAGYVQAFREHSTGSLACFTAHHFSHLDALYFTVGNLSTAGTGTIAPASQFCRGIVTLQLLVGIGVLGVIVAGVTAQLARSLTWRQAD